MLHELALGIAKTLGIYIATNFLYAWADPLNARGGGGGGRGGYPREFLILILFQISISDAICPVALCNRIVTLGNKIIALCNNHRLL